MLSGLSIAAEPTKQQIADYVNAVIRVNLYATSVSANDVPVISSPPSYYGDFATAWGTVKGHALEWPNSLVPLMLEFPTAVTSFNTLFATEVATASAALGDLRADPENQAARARLRSSLALLGESMDSHLRATQSLVGEQVEFSAQLAADAPTLSQLAKEALDAAGAEQKTAISKIMSSLALLDDTLKQESAYLDAARAGEITAVVFGFVAVVLKVLPEGGEELSEIVSKLAEAAEDAEKLQVALAEEMIKETNADIQRARAELELFEQDILLLNALNLQMQALVRQNQEAEKALRAVEAFWTLLRDEISTVVARLDDETRDISSGELAQAQKDLADAKASWAEVEDFAKLAGGIRFVESGKVFTLPSTNSS